MADIDQRLASFVGQLTEAVGSSCDPTPVCRAVKGVLTEFIRPGHAFLPADVLRPAKDHYARNLLHRDPQGRFCVIVMVWSEGQGTPIHDHGGLWCVECVYRGRIRVRSYDRGEDDGTHATFRETEAVVAGCGEAGHLIPPFDYHIIDNPFGDGAASTVHVYGGDMNHCRVFEPVGDGQRYLQRDRALAFAE
ncbi:MAG: cysteine dioxygenase family protein [Myxococcota bacterium]